MQGCKDCDLSTSNACAGVYASITIPSLNVGTVGGGTGLATQKECLDLIGCSGKVCIKLTGYYYYYCYYYYYYYLLFKKSRDGCVEFKKIQSELQSIFLLVYHLFFFPFFFFFFFLM